MLAERLAHGMHRRVLSLARSLTPLSLAILLLGCSIVAPLARGFESPRVQIFASKVESISHAYVRLRVELAIFNPNPYGLHPQRIRYRLSVNDIQVAEATQPGVTLTAEASTPFHLATDIPFDTLARAAAAAVLLGEVPYVLDGSLQLSSLFVERDVPFRASSVLRFNPPLDLAVPSRGWGSRPPSSRL